MQREADDEARAVGEGEAAPEASMEESGSPGEIDADAEAEKQEADPLKKTLRRLSKQNFLT